MYLDVSHPDEIWRRNPQLRTEVVFKRLVEQEGEEWANRVIYAIYLVHDPLSPYRRTLSEPVVKDLRKSIKGEFFSDPEDFSKFNWFTYKNLEKSYKNQIPKELKEWNECWMKYMECVTYFKELSPEDKGIQYIQKEGAALAEMKREFLELKKQILDSSESDSDMYGGEYGNIYS